MWVLLFQQPEPLQQVPYGFPLQLPCPCYSLGMYMLITTHCLFLPHAYNVVSYQRTTCPAFIEPSSLTCQTLSDVLCFGVWGYV